MRRGAVFGRIRDRFLNDAESLRSQRTRHQRIEAVGVEGHADSPLRLKAGAQLVDARAKIKWDLGASSRGPELFEVGPQLALLRHEHALDVGNHPSGFIWLGLDHAVDRFQSQDNAGE